MNTTFPIYYDVEAKKLLNFFNGYKIDIFCGRSITKYKIYHTNQDPTEIKICRVVGLKNRGTKLTLDVSNNKVTRYINDVLCKNEVDYDNSQP